MKVKIIVSTLAVLLGTFLLFSNTADADRVSPLASWRGFGHHYEEDEQIFSQEFKQREALTAACMQQQGQNYQTRILDNTSSQLNISDPNGDRSEARTSNEAYFLALYGEVNPEISTADLDTNADGVIDYAESFGGGCSGDAHREVLGVFAAKAILTEEYNQLRLEAQTSPVVLAAEQDWLACVAKNKDFQGSSRTQILSQLDAQLDQSETRALLDECEPGYHLVRQGEVIRQETLFVYQHQTTLEEFGVSVEG